VFARLDFAILQVQPQRHPTNMVMLRTSTAWLFVLLLFALSRKLLQDYLSTISSAPCCVSALSTAGLQYRKP
jgi:hypothetical protein